MEPNGHFEVFPSTPMIDSRLRALGTMSVPRATNQTLRGSTHRIPWVRRVGRYRPGYFPRSDETIFQHYLYNPKNSSDCPMTLLMSPPPPPEGCERAECLHGYIILSEFAAPPLDTMHLVYNHTEGAATPSGFFEECCRPAVAPTHPWRR